MKECPECHVIFVRDVGSSCPICGTAEMVMPNLVFHCRCGFTSPRHEDINQMGECKKCEAAKAAAASSLCPSCGQPLRVTDGSCSDPHCYLWFTPRASNPADTAPESILAEAASLVSERGDRHASYGTPLDNHTCTADLWTTWLRRRYGPTVPALSAEDVCLMMVLVKCAREANTAKRDNLVDIAGYAANAEMCGSERDKRLKEQP